MDQVQEVKVSTSNFGADQSKGPIVIDAVGKSGSAQFHGSLYSYFRNSALNSNDWLRSTMAAPGPASGSLYPGGYAGRPGADSPHAFQLQKKLVFWVGLGSLQATAPEALSQALFPVQPCSGAI